MEEGLRSTIHYNQKKIVCEYVFLLKRITKTSQVIDIKAGFQPVTKSQSTLFSNTSLTFSSIPTFNKDKKFYTPSFILLEDKLKIQQNNDQCLSNHIKKIYQFNQQKDQLLLPKPSKANRFCLICKQTYEDYLTHINYPSHHRFLQNSQYYNNVIQLCQEKYPTVTKLNKKLTKERKKKQPYKKINQSKNQKNQKLNQILSTSLSSIQPPQILYQNSKAH